MDSKVIAVLVHGTFSPNAAWTREGSHLCDALREAFGPDLHIERFEWSGANSFGARGIAAAGLAATIDDLAARHEFAKIVVIAHSHGGNVASYALAQSAQRERVTALVTLATPFVKVDGRRLEVGAGIFAAALGMLGLVLLLGVIKWVQNPVFNYLGKMEKGTWRWIVMIGAGLLLGKWGGDFVKSFFSALESTTIAVFEPLTELRDTLVRRATPPSRSTTPVLCIALQGDEARGFLRLVRLAKAPWEMMAMIALAVVAASTLGVFISLILDFAGAALGVGMAVLGANVELKHLAFADRLLTGAIVVDAAALAVVVGAMLLAASGSAVISGHPLGEGTSHVLAPILVRSKMALAPFWEGNVTLKRYSARDLWGKSLLSPFRVELAHSWAHSLPTVVHQVVEWLVERTQEQQAAEDPEREGQIERIATGVWNWTTRLGCVLPVIIVVLLLVAEAAGPIMHLLVATVKVGDPCDYSEGMPFARCLDKQTALMCIPAGKVLAVPCRGPTGCGPGATAGLSTCDSSIGIVGEPCSGQQWTCSKDHRERLQCESGSWKVIEDCLGPNGCRVSSVSSNAIALTCDSSVAALGGHCVGGSTCSVDHDALLECESGEWKRKDDCLGPEACRIEGQSVRCDRSRGRLAAVCSSPGAVSCSVDGKARLRCADGQFALDRKCHGPLGCRTIASGMLSCDQSLGEMGDPCDPDDFVCNSDKKSLLRCDAGRLVQDRKCRGDLGCWMSSDQIHCDQTHAQVGDRCNDGQPACSRDRASLLSCKRKRFEVEVSCWPERCGVLADRLGCGLR
jgi:pimeloyl-ACP methyl ester carboxylesterase